VNVVLWVCFALSGVGALALEMLWMRSAGLVLGATAPTAATVLAAYFSGLALGGFLARHAPSAPVRRYGLLELGAAAGALASYGVFRACVTDVMQHALGEIGFGARVVVIALTILPVTTALGATLPTLAHALATPENIGRRVGALYALNTLGGACGIGAMGFGLPLAIGVPWSYVVASMSSGTAGLLALAIGDSATSSSSAGAAIDERPSRILWVVAAGAGGVGIAFEIFWTMLFAQILHNSVYSFAAVTLVFVLAIAAGAALSALLLRVTTPTRVAVASLAAAGVLSCLGMWAFVLWTGGLRYFGMQHGLAEYVLEIIVLAGATAGPGVVAAGATLPALWAAFADRRTVARPVGALTAANLLGGVAGALAAAFVLMPSIGLRAGFFGAALAYVILALTIARGEPALQRVGYVALLIIVLATPLRAPLAYLKPGETLRAIAEGASGIVSVVDVGGRLQLRVDNYYVLGGTAGAANARRQGVVPLLLHPAPKRAVFVGVGTGITASAAVALGVPETTVIDLMPEIVTMARTHFASLNARLLDRADVRIVIDDGRRYLAATDSRFDVIVSDLFIPWHTGAGSLYSLEMYETAARRLAPDGVFCQWLPLHLLTRGEFDVIVKTFLQAFPHATLWRNEFIPDRPIFGLIGAHAPRSIDFERIEARVRALPAWSRDSLLETPRAMAMLYVADLSLAADLFAHARVNRDDRPVIEFLAPRFTRMSAALAENRLVGRSLADLTETLAARLSTNVEPTLPATRDAADARRAGALWFRYAVEMQAGNRSAADRALGELRRLIPDVVANAERAATTAPTENVPGR
jgi:spermidine synthase